VYLEDVEYRTAVPDAIPADSSDHPFHVGCDARRSIDPARSWRAYRGTEEPEKPAEVIEVRVGDEDVRHLMGDASGESSRIAQIEEETSLAVAKTNVQQRISEDPVHEKRLGRRERHDGRKEPLPAAPGCAKVRAVLLLRLRLGQSRTRAGGHERPRAVATSIANEERDRLLGHEASRAHAYHFRAHVQDLAERHRSTGSSENGDLSPAPGVARIQGRRSTESRHHRSTRKARLDGLTEKLVPEPSAPAYAVVLGGSGWMECLALDADDVRSARGKLALETPFPLVRVAKMQNDSRGHRAEKAVRELGSRHAAGHARDLEKEDVGLDGVQEPLESDDERQAKPRRVESADRLDSDGVETTGGERTERDGARRTEEGQGHVGRGDEGGDAPPPELAQELFGERLPRTTVSSDEESPATASDDPLGELSRRRLHRAILNASARP
jgi:hypothetical protein